MSLTETAAAHLSLASEISQAFEIGKAQVQTIDIKGVPALLAPKDMQVTFLKEQFDKLLDAPRRLEQCVELRSVQSFIEYYNRYATEQSTIFFDSETGKFLAVLDWHGGAESPSFLTHKATYNAPKTKEWSNWIEHNNIKMSQEDFALFIEENIKQIAEPNGSQMLEIASSLKATISADFKSGIRMDNGQVNFMYDQRIEGSAGVNGTIAIPESIKLIIKPFLNGAPYEIMARFRYRTSAKGLTLWYTLISPHLSVQDAVAEVVELVKNATTSGHIYEGKI